MTPLIAAAPRAAVQPDVRAGKAPTSLAEVVGDVDAFFATYWSRTPVLLHARADLSGLISEDEIWEELECGSLSLPYFTVFKDGVFVAQSEVTQDRVVLGRRLPGYADCEAIKRHFAAGATFKYSQAEHWHARIRDLVAALKPSFSGNLEAFVFLSPPDRTAVRAHTDGTHTIVLQVSGTKDWVVGHLTEESHSGSTLHEGEIDPERRLELTLHPGDVLYMPHGCPHYATARGGNSIHIAITVEEPTALDIAQTLGASMLSDPASSQALSSLFSVPATEKAQVVREALLRYLATVDEKRILDLAIALRRRG